MHTDNQIKCSNCGYDLQGLTLSALCPECGESRKTSASSYEVDSSEKAPSKMLKMIDANVAVKGLEDVPDIRNRVKYWMRIGALFVFSLALLQFLVMFALIPIPLYRVALFGMSLFWPAVVVGMMPASVDNAMPPIYRLIRKWIPPSQWCWAIGYVLWFVLYLPTEEVTFGGNFKQCALPFYAHLVAGLGFAGLAFWLHDLALRVGLDFVAKKCNIMTFAILSIGLIVFIAPWNRIATDPAGEVPSVPSVVNWLFLILLLFPWIWVLVSFGRGLLEFASDSDWSMKYEGDQEGRQDRIREKREAYEKERGW